MNILNWLCFGGMLGSMITMFFSYCVNNEGTLIFSSTLCLLFAITMGNKDYN